MALNQTLKAALDAAIEQQLLNNKSDRDATYQLAMLMQIAATAEQTDEVEDLMKSMLAKLDTLIAAQNTANTRLQTIITHVDQVESLLTDIKTNTGRIP